MKDLVVLVADKNMEFTVRGLLERMPRSENIRNITYDIFNHPENDPGILNHSHDFLRPLTQEYNYCMVLLDHEGCGHEQQSREEIEATIEHNLSANGWADRCCAIVISPELENWMWVNEVRLKNAIGWRNDTNIYQWLEEQDLKDADKPKPVRPKETFELL